MSAKKLDDFFVSSILRWGIDNYRTFPWRESTNPYHFLVVEILLQKTKAEQVIPVYNEFITNYPDIESLAKAKIKKLDELIAPIGLINRANRLKQIAKQITDEYNSKIPDNEKNLVELRGIGKYIARAILCFGFDRRVSIMDVNIGRILIRFYGLDQPKRIRDSRELWLKTDELLPDKEFRKYNLSLLDFGNSICSKRKPNCIDCLLNARCSFYQLSKD